MKSKTLFNVVALSLALVVSGTGCRHTPQNAKNMNGPEGPGNPTPLPPGTPLPSDNSNPVMNNGTQPALGTNDYSNWGQHPEILADQTIHFDYDKSAIKSSEESKLDAVADYLKNHAGIAVRIEGNCDERGTEEYNRSLGERRALAARQVLAQQGVDASRLDVITYGKDKPVATGHDEAAFSRNRRDDFVVLTPPGQ